MNLFYKAVAGVLEVESVDFNTRFREVPEWCSLKAFGLLVLMENDWKAPITIDRLRELNTVGELFGEAFLAFAAELLKVDRNRLTGMTAYGSLTEWDSVNHLRLAMEAEKRFGLSYALERIPKMVTLADFVTMD